MTTILIKLRNLLDDNYESFIDLFTYMGISHIFTLTQSNVDSTSLQVSRNGTILTSSQYSFNATMNQLTITTLTAGDSIQVIYNAYQKYSDNSLRAYIRRALIYLSIEQYKTFKCGTDNTIFPTPSEPEENLIAIIANSLINQSISSYRTPEISITFLENEDVDEKIHRVIAQFRKTYGVIKYVKWDRDVKIDREDE